MGRVIAARPFLVPHRLIVTAAVAAALGALAAAPHAQPPVREAEAGRRADERIQALQREAEALARAERTLLGDLRKLEIDRDLRREEARRLQAQIDALAAERRLDRGPDRTLEATIAAARPALDARLVQTYKLGRPGYARLLLGRTTPATWRAPPA